MFLGPQRLSFTGQPMAFIDTDATDATGISPSLLGNPNEVQ